MSDCNESEADIGHQQTGLPLENGEITGDKRPSSFRVKEEMVLTGGVASSLDASLESEDNQETCSALVNDVLQAANEVAREQFLQVRKILIKLAHNHDTKLVQEIFRKILFFKGYGLRGNLWTVL